MYNFSGALELLKQGKPVYRRDWVPYLVLEDGKFYLSFEGTLVRYIVPEGDILAEDWDVGEWE